MAAFSFLTFWIIIFWMIQPSHSGWGAFFLILGGHILARDSGYRYLHSDTTLIERFSGHDNGWMDWTNETRMIGPCGFADPGGLAAFTWDSDKDLGMMDECEEEREHEALRRSGRMAWYGMFLFILDGLGSF